MTVNGTRVEGVDGTNPRELTRAEMEARRQAAGLTAWLRAHKPGFEHCYIFQTGQQLGVRETRRILGEYGRDDGGPVGREPCSHARAGH